MKPRQLTLSLDPTARFSAEDFLVATANQKAHTLLTTWPNWPARGLLLCGPPGSGKSHLAAIWATHADAQVCQAADLMLPLIAELPSETRLAVENIDVPDGSERNLFHLMNAARERNIWLLLSASQGPSLVWPKLPDLASRLRALPCVEIGPPDDRLVRAVLVKLFDDRQLAVDADVIDYIARRMERSLGAAREIVAALDREALALGRRVTKPVASAVLARLTSEVD